MSEVVFYGEVAEFAKKIDASEWEFFKYANDVAEQIYHLMEVQGVNKTEFAEKLGTSKAFITKVLRGDANLTFKTFIKLVNTLDGKISTHVSLKEDQVQWLGIVKKKKERAKGLGNQYISIKNMGYRQNAETTIAA